jgi:hypothetical protein
MKTAKAPKAKKVLVLSLIFPSLFAADHRFDDGLYG